MKAAYSFPPQPGQIRGLKRSFWIDCYLLEAGTAGFLLLNSTRVSQNVLSCKLTKLTWQRIHEKTKSSHIRADATATLDLLVVSKYILAADALNLWCKGSQQQEKIFLPGKHNK